jgi:BMFP domain-containing protein YqiC
MQSQNRIFEDLSRIANGAAGTFAGAAREFESVIREGVNRFMAGQNFVSRDEFEAVKEMAATARAEVEELKARLDAMTADAAGAAAAGAAKRPRKGAPEA